MTNAATQGRVAVLMGGPEATDSPASAEIRAAREAAGLSAREAASLVGVTTLTWQRWEGQSARHTEIPHASWNLFLLLVGAHPVFTLSDREGSNRRIER